MTDGKHKYGLLLTREASGLSRHIPVKQQSALMSRSIDSLIREDLGDWKSWLGSLTWRAFDGERVMFLCHAPSARPGVNDHENEALASRCRWAWYAYQLSRPSNPSFGSCIIASGRATLDAGEPRPSNIQSWSITHKLVRPGYMGTRGYQLAQNEDWPHIMAEILQAIEAGTDDEGRLPPVTDTAVSIYSYALRGGFADLRIPSFVRASEVVLGLPRGSGEREFAKRGTLAIGPVVDDTILSGCDLEAELRAIYRLRSDCVHGKVPFQELQARGQLDDLGRFEYLAETLANRTTRWAIENPGFLRTLPNRAALEAAWKANHADLPA